MKKKSLKKDNRRLERAIKMLERNLGRFSTYSPDSVVKNINRTVGWLKELRKYRKRDARLDEAVRRTIKQIDEMGGIDELDETDAADELDANETDETDEEGKI